MFKFSSSCPSDARVLPAAVEHSGPSGSSSVTSTSSRATREDSYTSNMATREDSGSSSSSRVAVREDSGSSSRIGAIKHEELQPVAVGAGSRVMVDAANLLLTAAAPASAFDGMMAKVCCIGLNIQGLLAAPNLALGIFFLQWTLPHRWHTGHGENALSAVPIAGMWMDRCHSDPTIASDD
jgi:hypothetical protein